MAINQVSSKEIEAWRASFDDGAPRATAAIAVSIAVMIAGAIFLSAAPVIGSPSVKDAAADGAQAAPSTAAAKKGPGPLKPLAAAGIDKVAAAGLPDQSRKAPTPTNGSASPDQAHAFLALAPRLKPRTVAIGRKTPPAEKLAGETLAAKNAPAAERGFAPRLKPQRAAAQTHDQTDVRAAAPLKISNAARRPMTFGGFAIPAEEDNPPPFFFTSDITPDRTPPPPLAVAMAGDLADDPVKTSVTLTRGETFVDALRRAGVRAEDRNAAAAAFGKIQNLRKLRPGQAFVLTTAAPNKTIFQAATTERSDDFHLLALDFRADAENRIELARADGGAFEAAKTAIPLTTRIVSIAGRIEGSLFVSARRAGAPTPVIGELANMFAYDVDFQRDIFGGDEFEAIFEVLYDTQGNLVGAGDILYGRLKWRGRTKEKGYYRFASANGDKVDYYDRAGQSAKRLLMKTPIDGARLSSGFGTRKHPILGYRKAHKGVDFAAARGTPIYAAGDGVVERANRYGSFGNYIRIRHANGYKTAYAHLKGFRRGIRAGKRVRQGDVIAYVGTTGRSTGPHLHYEVHLNGKAVNPQKLKIATGVQLKGSALEAFNAARDSIEAMRAAPEPGEAVYAEDEAATRASL